MKQKVSGLMGLTLGGSNQVRLPNLWWVKPEDTFSRWAPRQGR